MVDRACSCEREPRADRRGGRQLHRCQREVYRAGTWTNFIVKHHRLGGPPAPKRLKSECPLARGRPGKLRLLILRAGWVRLLRTKRIEKHASPSLFSRTQVSRQLIAPKTVVIGGLLLTGSALLAPMVAKALELAPGLTLKTELTFEAETQRSFDLDDSERDGFTFLEPRVNLELEIEPADQIKAIFEVEGTLREIIEDDADDELNERKLETKQAYIEFEPDGTDLTLAVGRQDISDDMEWLIDESLDSVRVTYEADPIGFDVYVGRQSLVNLSTPAEEEELITDYAAFLRYKFSDKSYADAYVFFRDGERFLDGGEITEENLLFLGVQSIGEINSQLSYWFNAAYLTGDSREGDGKVDISAFGANLGATYTFDTQLEPSITLGFAYGSGDPNTDDDVDRGFRQTGLHGNSHRFNGVASFSYLGQLLDPEIGNLMIFTAGFGIKPSERSSLDLVYHYYSQVEASDDLVDTNLDMDPDGESKDIGHAFDLVFGYREIENVTVEAAVGAFVPGNAFPDGSGTAYFGQIEITYSF
jgi:alginate production protein